MSGDIIKSLNNINISVHENDQMLWEFQAVVKCNNEAIEKLKEECGRLNKEITEAAEEICKIEQQIKILESSYDVSNASLLLNLQSLINQRVHKKCIVQKIKKHEEEADKLIDEYTQYIQTCKEKLELTNPTYKILQVKRIEFRQRKIHCIVLQPKIMKLKYINKQKIEIKHQLFYNDIIEFARNWIDNKKYLKATDYLKQESRKERELMKKLTEVTELLKQKQTSRFLRNQANDFNIPHIEFPMNVVEKNKEKTAAQVPTQMNNTFDGIITMLEKKDANLTINSKMKEDQNLKYNINNSKVRILENKTLKKAQDIIKPCNIKSKAERSKEIAAKIQKVVQNFNKSISRQNSRKSAPSSQKCSTIENKLKEKLSQQLNVSQEYKINDINQNSQKDPYDGSGATQEVQNLNITGAESKKIETNTFNQGSSGYQFPNDQLSYINTENDISKVGSSSQRNPNENYGNTFAQNTNFLSQALSNINKTTEPTEYATTSMNRNYQFCSNFDSKIQGGNSIEKPTSVFSTSGFNNALGSTKNTNHATFLDSYTGDSEVTFRSPQFSPNYTNTPTEENNVNVAANLFSFGQFNSSSLFNLKLN